MSRYAANFIRFPTNRSTRNSRGHMNHGNRHGKVTATVIDGSQVMEAMVASKRSAVQVTAAHWSRGQDDGPETSGASDETTVTA